MTSNQPDPLKPPASPRRVAKSIVLCVATLMLPRLAMASPAPTGQRDYLIDIWDTDRGLPTSSVTSMAQTPEGYLWVGTQNGLLRFDGLRFVAFDPDNTAALKHARVEHLFVDPAGTLWINTYDGSLTSWRRGAFAHEWSGTGAVQFEAFLAPSRRGETVFALDAGAVIRRHADARMQNAWQILRPPQGGLVPLFAGDAHGDLWIRSNDDRLWRVRATGLEKAPTDGLAGNRIQCLSSDFDGRIWVGTDAEIAVFDGNRFRTMTPTNGEARLNVSIMMFTRDGGHWVVANDRARKARGRQWIWTGALGHGLTGAYRQTVNVLEDRRGDVWFAHYGKGMLHVRQDGSARRITAADGLPGNRVRQALEDREGNLWLAVDRGGLVRLRDRRFQAFIAVDGAGATPAAAVAEGRDNSIWIGSMGGGLQRYRDGVITRFALPSATSGGFVFSVFPDAQDRIWMSADREDLFYFEGGRVKPAPFSVHGIKTILVDRDNGLWLGTKSGLSRIVDGRLETFGPREGFVPRDVRALAQDAQGTLWIGSGDGSIYRFRAGALERVDMPDVDAHHPIWSLLTDSDGTLWVGTFRGGLLRLADRRVTRYTTKEGLPSNIICQILDDGRGQLWVGSYNGIFRVAKASLASFADRQTGAIPIASYGKSDGLPTLECSGNYQPSGWKGRNGRLWFATPRGVVSVDPTEPSVDRRPPAVVIEELRIDQEPAPLEAAGQAVEIGSGPHRIEFRYTGVSFNAPEQVRFRYRMDPLEQAWVEAGSQRSAQYSYLPPGEYRFIVAASIGDGHWSADGASVGFRILPHFSETWWFRALAGLVATLVVAGIVRYLSTRRLRLKLERLELQRAIERDRGRIARDIHDDLGAGLT
jgi:ligand-binding sensor domain-containing protein